MRFAWELYQTKHSEAAKEIRRIRVILRWLLDRTLVGAIAGDTVGSQRCQGSRRHDSRERRPDDPATRARFSFATIRDRLAAVDPGGFAARTALRAAVALTASALLLLAFGPPYGDPVSSPSSAARSR